MTRAKTVYLAMALICAAGSASAAPLSIVTVNAPAINCVFNATCAVTVTDTIGDYPPKSGYTGVPRLQSRTYPGAAAAPAAGLIAFVYRVDFTSAAAATDVNCATDLKINFGPVVPLPYAAGGSADIFVVTTGGLGTIAPTSATQVGNFVTFNFATPVCPGQTSFFFGLASHSDPHDVTAKSSLTYGGGEVSVPARAPAH